MAQWDRGSARSPLESLEEHIVRQIRIWQPDVIVSDAVHPDGRQPVAHLISQLTMRAVQLAGDPATFPDQIVLAGLDPWSVKKVFAALPAGQHGSMEIENERLAVHLGCSLTDYSAMSRALVLRHRTPAPASLALRLLQSSAVHDNAGRELFAGVLPGAIGESRRAAVPSTGVSIDSLSRVMQQQRAIQALAAQGNRSTEKPNVALAQLDSLIRGLPPHQAGIMLQRTAQQFVDQEDYEAAAAIEAGFVERFPDHVFSESSIVWLLRHYSSAEWQHAFGRRAHAISTQHAAIRLPPANPIGVTDQSQPLNATTSLQRAGFTNIESAPLLSANDAKNLQYATGWGQLLQARYGGMFHEPAIQFQLASVHRRLGNPLEVSRIFNGLNAANLSTGWRSCLRGEEWLGGIKGTIPVPTIQCPRIDTKPYLDGILDEPFWNVAPRAEMKSSQADNSLPAEVRFSQDEEYLYFAVCCPLQTAASYKTTPQPRLRDADLRANDRIEIALDIDRDYTTFYRLTLDYRGWTNDACCDEPSWNPSWHVAATCNERLWVVEVAVPFTEMEPGQPGSRQPWAMMIRRFVPNGDSQSWPSSVEPHDELRPGGYLLFR